MNSIAIVGGGISGLSAAYFLSRQGYRCTLVEAQPRLGGVIRTERVEECVVEAGPDSFISQKPWALELIRELGIADQVIGSNDHQRRTYILREGRLVALPDGVQFLAPTKIFPMLTTRLLSWRAKAEMAREWFRRPGDQGAEPADRSVAEFVTDHYGREVNEYLAQPMLAGVYGGSPERLSMNSVLPRFVEMERRHGSLTRGLLQSRRRDGREAAPKGRSESLFLSLKGGMQQLTDTLATKLEGKVRRLTGTVQAVQGQAGSFRLAVNGETLEAGQVVLAVPAYQAAAVLKTMDPRLSELLTAIPYTSSVTAALLYHRPEFDHPLNGFGVLIPRAEQKRLAACTWVNTKFPHRAAPGRALLRGFLAGEQAEEVSDWDDERLARVVHEELKGLMGFRPEPAAWRVHRWDRAMAQYEVGHQKRLEEIETRLAGLPGLHLAGNGYIGIGIPDCVRRSRMVAGNVMKEAAAVKA